MKNKAAVEAVLRELEFVEWDRYHSFGEQVAFFGWINREDQYKDFVVIHWNPETARVEGYHTSSAKYTEAIGDILGIPHSDCHRVEDKFAIENMVELQNRFT